MGTLFTCDDDRKSSSIPVILCYSNGEKYIGEFNDGVKNGHGTYFYSNGDRYEGQWVHNMKHGRGTFYENDGALYIGDWDHNVKEGQGQYFYLNGSRYMGDWKNNKQNGTGCFTTSNGSTYEGIFLNDKKHGKGIYVNKHHKFQEEWNEGNLVDRKTISGSLGEITELDTSIYKNERSPPTSLIPSQNSNSIEKPQDNIYKSSSLKNLQSVFSSNRTELNVGQETLSLIDYIDENFPILHKNIFEWDLLDVSNWLKHIGLEQYVTIFQNNHIIGKNLFDIKEQELKEDFQMISVGHRKNLLHSIEYLNKIYIENKGRRMSIIRNKLAQFYYKKGNQINWKTKKVKSLCDVIEEEDDNNENNLKSLPEEHEINEKYKALRKELWNSKIRNKKNSMDSSIGVEENKKELFPIQDELKSILGRKNTKSGTPLEKSPSLLGEEIKDEVYDDHNFILKNLKENGIECLIDYKELEILEPIGKGSYGQVFKGRWLGQDVAIKHYDQRASKLKKKRLINFLKEVEIMTYLRHPNIVLFMGVTLNDAKYLMVTEYLCQGSLFDHLHVKHTEFDEEMMLNICEDIALGMCYLHGRKVFHCDLKSSNILLDESFGVKLCDFGLSRIHSKIDKEGGRIGTPHWMAPEIMRGEKYDEFSDVYSYGMILWEILTKQIPYAGIPILKIINSVGYDEYRIPLPKHGTPLILDIMNMCLNKTGKMRPNFKKILEKLQERKKHKRKYVINQLNGFFGEE